MARVPRLPAVTSYFKSLQNKHEAAAVRMRDGRARSAMGLCLAIKHSLANGRVEDEELFLLLSG
mgnify:CR=1 FL=1